MTDAAPPVVLVSGATGGIGGEVVRAYAARGARLVLLARSAGRLRDLAAEAHALGAPATLVTVADVADAGSVDTALQSTLERFGQVDVVVHAAAVMTYGRLTDVPQQTWDRAVTVGILGTSNVARAALRAFGAEGGHLVVVGSVLGRVTAPFMGAYIAGKFAVRGLVRVLQQEARSTPGVRVALVEPGAVDTPIYGLAATYLGRIGRPPPPVSSPARVARAVVSAVDRDRRTVSVGIANPVMRWGFSALPAVYDRLVTPLMTLAGLARGHVEARPGNVFEASERVELTSPRRLERSSGR